MWVHKQEPALTQAEGFLLPLLHLRAHPLLDEDRAQETACTLCMAWAAASQLTGPYRQTTLVS